MAKLGASMTYKSKTSRNSQFSIDLLFAQIELQSQELCLLLEVPGGVVALPRTLKNQAECGFWDVCAESLLVQGRRLAEAIPVKGSVCSVEKTLSCAQLRRKRHLGINSNPRRIDSSTIDRKI
jgi:hypothetical protein